MINPALPQITLPTPLSLPLKAVPEKIHSKVMAGLLNRVLKEYLQEGELDMLEGKTLRVEVKDAQYGYSLTVHKQKLAASAAAADVIMSGNIHDFLLMLTRKEDPDTLFFQRRLSIQGDTGLGLSVKNFLDSIDWDSLPLPGVAQKGLDKALQLYQKALG